MTADELGGFLWHVAGRPWNAGVHPIIIYVEGGRVTRCWDTAQHAEVPPSTSAALSTRLRENAYLLAPVPPTAIPEAIREWDELRLKGGL